MSTARAKGDRWPPVTSCSDRWTGGLYIFYVDLKTPVEMVILIGKLPRYYLGNIRTWWLVIFRTTSSSPQHIFNPRNHPWVNPLLISQLTAKSAQPNWKNIWNISPTYSTKKISKMPLAAVVFRSFLFRRFTVDQRMGPLPSSTTHGLTRWVEEDRLVPVGTKPQGRSGTHRSPGVIIPSRVTLCQKFNL